jgi:hypothetical protein
MPDPPSDEAPPALPSSDEAPPAPPSSDEAPSALPSALARILAFSAIVVAGLCGGLIGYAVADLQCTGDCTVQNVLAAAAGALMAAGGVAIIAALVLRAMSEWQGGG